MVWNEALACGKANVLSSLVRLEILQLCPQTVNVKTLQSCNTNPGGLMTILMEVSVA